MRAREPDLASGVNVRVGVLSVASGGRYPWDASPEEESHAPNPCPPLHQLIINPKQIAERQRGAG